MFRAIENCATLRASPAIRTTFLSNPIPLRDIRPDVLKVKDTLRSTVNLTFDGRVVKAYHGPNARERFDNEVRVLHYLEQRGCDFVPRILEADAEGLRIITSSCGSRVERIDDEKVKQLFAEVEQYGVRHDDPDPRNITYRQSDGRFCVIDFELATILAENGAHS